MKIVIEYNSIWQNSFLYGDKDEIPKGKKKGDFKATSKNNKIDNRMITKSTILGILSRLIGDQRKLYQAMKSKDYYFKGKEELINFQIDKEESWSENVYIVNKTEKRPFQSTYLGVIKDDEKLFFSDTAPLLWSILSLNLDELLDFILSNTMNKKTGDSHPDNLLRIIKEIQKLENIILIKDEVSAIENKIQNLKERYLKKEQEFLALQSKTLKQKNSLALTKKKKEENILQLEDEKRKILSSEKRNFFDSKIIKVIELLSQKFPNQVYYNNDRIFPMSLYAAALYLQVERMMNNNFNVDYCLKKDKQIQIQGFSKRSFNGIRDFLNKLAGNQNKTTGTPYPLTKADGTLTIEIDIPREEAKELKNLIDNAGVSSFYLGKKGLAYVTNISTKEVKEK